MSKSIVKACVKYNGRFYTGFDHGECFKKLRKDNPFEETKFTKIVHSEIEQGFVDSDGDFVDRKQAMIIAKERGQLTYENDKKTLISEDLHLNWLNEQAERIAELEEQLENAIVPKFKIGQEVWTIRHNNSIYHTRIDEIKVVNIQGKNEIFYYYDQPGSYAHCEVIEEDVYATKEEALAKLEELKGNNYE